MRRRQTVRHQQQGKPASVHRLTERHLHRLEAFHHCHQLLHRRCHALVERRPLVHTDKPTVKRIECGETVIMSPQAGRGIGVVLCRADHSLTRLHCWRSMTASSSTESGTAGAVVVCEPVSIAMASLSGWSYSTPKATTVTCRPSSGRNGVQIAESGDGGGQTRVSGTASRRLAEWLSSHPHVLSGIRMLEV